MIFETKDNMKCTTYRKEEFNSTLKLANQGFNVEGEKTSLELDRIEKEESKKKKESHLATSDRSDFFKHVQVTDRTSEKKQVKT